MVSHLLWLFMHINIIVVILTATSMITEKKCIENPHSKLHGLLDSTCGLTTVKEGQQA